MKCKIAYNEIKRTDKFKKARQLIHKKAPIPDNKLLISTFLLG